MTSLSQQVHTNLVHYNKWSDVQFHGMESGVIVSGIPPTKLDSRDAPNSREWVVPRSYLEKPELSVDEINTWFVELTKLGSRPLRITIGIVSDDGTIVYYFIYDGVVKPPQN